MAFADDAWRYVHGLAGGEVQLIYYVSYMFLAWGALVAVSLQVVSAPYGRYARKGWGIGVTANVAWAIQELPSFAVPLLLLALSDSPKIHDLPNKIILGLFLLHYFQRYVIRVDNPNDRLMYFISHVNVYYMLYHIFKYSVSTYSSTMFQYCNLLSSLF